MIFNAIFDFFDLLGEIFGGLWRAVRDAARSSWNSVLDVVAPRRTPVGLAGAGLTILGTLLPWGTYSGFPGRMTLAFSPLGARLYVLLLGLSGVFLLVDVAGRRRAGIAAATGALVVTVLTFLAIAVRPDEPGSLSYVAVGAYLSLVGSLLLLAALASLPVGPEPVVNRRLNANVEMLFVALSLGLLLVLVVEGLSIESGSQFAGYVTTVVCGALVLLRLGVSAWLATMFERRRQVTVLAGLIAAVVFPFTQGGADYWVRVASSILVFAVAAIGLNVVVGLAGLLDLGYIAFFGVGAYVGGLFGGARLAPPAFADLEMPFYVVIVLGALIAAVFGVVIGAPTLRLRGDYLAIVTLAFGEIFKIAANNLDGSAGPNITRGPNGIAQIPNLNIAGVDFSKSFELFGVPMSNFANYYFLELLLIGVVILVFSRLNTSRIGRAWVAIREDETAASAMGVNTFRLKMLAFAIGAFLAGSAGTVNAHLTTQVSPDSYTFLESVYLLAAVVLGGMGTVVGALLGASVLYVMPEKLRFFDRYRLLIFGLLLALMMRFRPEGILASKRRQQELHDEHGDAMSAPPGGPVASV